MKNLNYPLIKSFVIIMFTLFIYESGYTVTLPQGIASFTFFGFDKLYLVDTAYISKIKMNANKTILMNMFGVDYHFGYLSEDEIDNILNSTSTQTLPNAFQKILDSKDQTESVKKIRAFLGINSAIGNIKPIDPESPEEALGMKYSIQSESPKLNEKHVMYEIRGPINTMYFCITLDCIYVTYKDEGIPFLQGLPSLSFSDMKPAKEFIVFDQTYSADISRAKSIIVTLTPEKKLGFALKLYPSTSISFGSIGGVLEKTLLSGTQTSNLTLAFKKILDKSINDVQLQNIRTKMKIDNTFSNVSVIGADGDVFSFQIKYSTQWFESRNTIYCKKNTCFIIAQVEPLNEE